MVRFPAILTSLDWINVLGFDVCSADRIFYRMFLRHAFSFGFSVAKWVCKPRTKLVPELVTRTCVGIKWHPGCNSGTKEACMKKLSTCLSIIAFSLVILAGRVVGRDEMTKTDYINNVESQVSDWDNKIAKLRSDRSSLPVTSDRYKKVDKTLADMDSKVKKARGEIAELRSSTDADWSKDRSKIDKTLGGLQHDYNEALAE
jgi:hypothetical protein